MVSFLKFVKITFKLLQCSHCVVCRIDDLEELLYSQQKQQLPHT